MTSIYKSPHAQQDVRRWCLERIARWDVPCTRREIATSAGRTSTLTAGPETDSRSPCVVLLPGTNMGAAQCLAAAEVLARVHRVTVVDLPGQPGLSTQQRPRSRRMDWYGRWLGEVLAQIGKGSVVLVGHSLGGAVALAGNSPRVIGRVILSSAGITRLKVTTPIMAASLPWLLRPSVPRAARLLRHMSDPGHVPSSDLSAWMDLVARSCRTSLAPSPLPSALLDQRRRQPILAVAGGGDPFLPPETLAPAMKRRLGTELRVMDGAGHLLLEEKPNEVCALVEQFCVGLRPH
ncbi:alpha/beta hydrolase [Streptomyces microflavus]|uniref:alpha/beta fold hydrolase n=1 Tax=Streptomyces microflavus TaxID=1919 RepID=UPI0033BDBB4A